MVEMKTQTILLLFLLLFARAGHANYYIAPTLEAHDKTSEVWPEAAAAWGGRIGKAICEIKIPNKVTVEWRSELLTHNLRTGPQRPFLSYRPHLIIPLTDQECETIKKTMKGRAAIFRLIDDTQSIAFTGSYISDWSSKELALFTGQDRTLIERLRNKGIEVEEKASDDGKWVEEFPRPRQVHGGYILTLIRDGTIPNPVEARPTHAKEVLTAEPVILSCHFLFRGINRADRLLDFDPPDEQCRNLRVSGGKSVLTPIREKLPATNLNLPGLFAGDRVNLRFNLSRQMGCHYTGPGTDKVILEYGLGISVFYADPKDPCLKFLETELTVYTYEPAKLQPMKEIEADKELRLILGTYMLPGGAVTFMAFSAKDAPPRLLRLDPPPGVTGWDLQWDAGKKQAHILATGPKSRYWVSAVDRLDFEARQEVPPTSKLAVKDGSVHRHE
jgi:hypothetical protein